MKKHTVLTLVMLFIFASCSIDDNSAVVEPTAASTEPSTSSAEFLTENMEEDTRTVLTVFSINPVLEVENLVYVFNENNEDYRIDIIKYKNTAEDRLRMQIDITSGILPDIYDITFIPFMTSLKSKGYFEDLYPYIDADPELSREDFLPQIITALEFDGKLYEAFSRFAIITAISLNKTVKNAETWDDIRLIYENNPNYKELFVGFDRMTILKIICAANDFIDWEAGECHFESSDFIELLNLVKSAPVIDDGGQWNIKSIDPFLNGEALLYMNTINLMEQLIQLPVRFGEDYLFVELPGAGYAFDKMSATLAISSKSKHKDAAWQFVREVLTKEYGGRRSVNMLNLAGSDYKYDFPINASMFYPYIDKLVSADPDTKDKIPAPISNYETINIPRRYTEKEKALLLYLLNNTTTFLADGGEAMNIIAEECGPFFSGDKTAEDTAKIIQSRVSIYVNEQL